MIAEAVQRPPRRVLMVTGAYYPEISSSGVQCQSMARELAGRIDVHVLTTAVDPGLARREIVDGVPVTRIFVDVTSGASKLAAGVRLVWQLIGLIAGTDVVHLHGFSTKNVIVTLIAKLFRRPVVLSLHTAGHDELDAIERQGSLALWSFLSADLYLSVSPSLVDAYLASGLPAAQIRLIPNGIDLNRFSPAPPDVRRDLRVRLGFDARPVVLFVGFFSQDKQPRVLFDAWLQLQASLPTTLVFVGNTGGSYFEVDDRLAAGMRGDAEALGLGGRVIFAGPTLDVQDYFRAADVFVLPSRREGLPVALLEAMAAALPCVASRLPGSTDTIIDDGVSGVLVPAGDVDALATAIAGILADSKRAMRLGAEARETIARRFASADVADRWLEAYTLLPDRSPH
jgi:glycosyltransferase involved in cell wall biosynthesis